MEKFPAKCDCGCGRKAVIAFNGHYFHAWECTAGYQKEEPPKEAHNADA